MTQCIRVLGHKVNPSSLPLLGVGGTAYVYDLSGVVPGKVLKLFRQPSEFSGKEKSLATERLKELSERLEQYPTLPSGMAGPEGVITDQGAIVGLVMQKVRGVSLSNLCDSTWRKNHRYSDDKVRSVFHKIGRIFEAAHALGLVIGDVKPDNVLVNGIEPTLIDLEGIQFGAFTGRGFTPQYVDPLICRLDKQLGGLSATAKFSPSTDWYSFGAMYFEALTFVSPWGGTLWRSRCKAPIDDAERPLAGVSVFSSAVTVPRFARVKSLTPAVAEYFEGLFTHWYRRPFPLELLEGACGALQKCTFTKVRGGVSSSADL